MEKIPRYLILSLVFLALVAPSASAAGSASLFFSPSGGTYRQGENFTVSVIVRSDISVNAAGGLLTFPTNRLEVLRVGKNSSVVSLWIQEPSFSNAGEVGNVSFEGVMLNPGFIGPAGKVLDVVFRVRSAGTADLKFLRATILANDGLGTNVTALNGGAAFVLAPATAGDGRTGTSSPQVIVLREVPGRAPEGILQLWDILPYWIKVVFLAFVGIATVIFGLIFISFGLIILVYLWKYAFSKREVVLRKSGLLLKLAWHHARRAVRKVVRWTKIGGREFGSDIEYAIEELKKDFQKTAGDRLPPLGRVIEEYWLSVWRIIKRFFTRNESSPPDEGGEDERNRPTLP